MLLTFSKCTKKSMKDKVTASNISSSGHYHGVVMRKIESIVSVLWIEVNTEECSVKSGSTPSSLTLTWFAALQLSSRNCKCPNVKESLLIWKGGLPARQWMIDNSRSCFHGNVIFGSQGQMRFSSNKLWNGTGVLRERGAWPVGTRI